MQGQVFEYDPRRERMRVLFASPDAAALNNPDNVSRSLLPVRGGKGRYSPVRRVIIRSQTVQERLGKLFPNPAFSNFHLEGL